MKLNTLIPIVCFSIISCKNKPQPTNLIAQNSELKKEAPQSFQNKAHELVNQMVQKVGNYSKWLEKKDVVYTYTYSTPDGKTDLSTEKYIFNGELSYGIYKQHERTFPQLEGVIEQGYDGNEFWLKNKGEVLSDEKLLKGVAFKRPTNFYWFAMLPKLLDPGLNYEYVEEKKVDNKSYDVVKVTFGSIDNKPKDIYQIYIKKETKLVDEFLFTVMEFGRAEPLLMKIEYDTVEGLLIPTKRKYKPSNWAAEDNDGQWTNVNWTNIKFNNSLTKADFKK